MSLITPNTTNDDQLATLWKVNRELRTKIDSLSNNDAWKQWRVDVTNCLGTKVPKMLEERDMKIINVLANHTDSPSIQAAILSMIWQHKDARMLMDDINITAARREDRLDFTSLVCRVLTLATQDLLSRRRIYTNVCSMLQYIAKHWISCKIQNDITPMDVYENKPTILHTIFTIANASLCVLEKIYELQRHRAHQSVHPVRMDIDGMATDTVQTIDNIQQCCTELLGEMLCDLKFSDTLKFVNYRVVMRKLFRQHMPQILGIAKLTRYMDHHTDRAGVHNRILTYSLRLYNDVFTNTTSRPGVHNNLDNLLQEAEESILEHMFVLQKRVTLRHDQNTPYYDATRYHDTTLMTMFEIHKFRVSLDIAALPMALRLVPVLMKYFHVFPLYPTAHSHILGFLCSLNSSASATPPEIQHSILTGLVEKVNDMDVTDILMKFKTSRRPGGFRHELFTESQLDPLLQTLISNSLEIKTRQNSIDIALLVQTRIFDVLVMKLHRWLDGEQEKEEGFLQQSLQILLQLLELRPYYTGRGFMFVCVDSSFVTSRGSRRVCVEKQRFEIPSSETGQYISKAVQDEMRDLLKHPTGNLVRARVLRITFGYILNEIAHLPILSNTHRTLWARMLPLLVVNTHNQIPKVGQHWNMSSTVPDHMENLNFWDVNYSVTEAVDKNPMLKNSLGDGVLFFSDTKWREFQVQQSLYVPHNSTVCQRGLCGGWVEINGMYFQPVVKFSVHQSLRALLVWVVTSDQNNIMTPTAGENICYGLAFIEAMLDEVMNVEQNMNMQFLIHTHLSKLLQLTDVGTDVHAQACHTMRKFVEMLDIPKIAHRLKSIHTILLQIANSNVSQHLFQIIGSMPQQTPQQCKMVIDASVILVYTHAIKTEKFSTSAHQHQVDRALQTARRSTSQHSTEYSQELVQTLSSLSECCEKS
jgi:hypothetical protein